MASPHSLLHLELRQKQRMRMIFIESHPIIQSHYSMANSQHILLHRPSFRNLQSLIPPLLPQRNKNPKPRNHLHKRPRKQHPVLESLTPGTWVVCFGCVEWRGVGEEVGVECYAEEEE
jgi:hypothetical protein